MGYRMIKHLESTEYNRKLFYLDRGAIDLPPITDLTSITPGSESRSLTTGEKWILNTKYKWVYVGTCGWCGCTGGSGSGNSGGSGSGDGDVPVPGEEPTINDVTLTPQNITVGLGATISFNAQVDGSSQLNQGITWTIKGQNSVQTTISPDGILHIAENEKNKTITVRATSQGDTTKYAQAVVTVDPEVEEPLVETIVGIQITPREIEVIRGCSVLFSAQITGANISNYGVHYSISGQTSINTTINDNGLLQLASDELSKLIVVKAVADGNPNVFNSTTVTTVNEQDAQNPVVVTGIEVIPNEIELGVGQNTKLAAVIRGEMNPPQDVTWSIKGATDLNTRITSNGLLFIGENEKPGLLSVEAVSTFDPTFFAEVDVIVIGKDDPQFPEDPKTPTVTAIIVQPDSVEVQENTLKIFSAVVIGNNDPSQAVTWTLSGAQVSTTYCTDQGVVIVGRGETAKILTLTATSVQDPTKVGMAYIKVTQPTFEPASGIEDVPKAPLGARYVRQRLVNGETAWILLPEEEEEGPVEPDPEIRDIQVDPEVVTVAPGSVITYTVKMDTIGELTNEVVWSLKGNDSLGTNITPDGILYIADDETSKLISIRATSILDDTKYGRATVTVDAEAPIITQVTAVKILPANAEIIRGRSMKFQAIVTGINLTDQNVSWTLTGNNNLGTAISNNGTLVVDANESASVLIVTATSKADPSYSAACVVAVIPEEAAVDVWEITRLVIYPDETIVGQRRNVRFACVVEGINNPPQDVIWSVSGNEDIETHMSQDGILYCGDDEKINHRLYVMATSVYDSSKTATTRSIVVVENDPGVVDTTVSSVVVTPSMIEAKKGEKITFIARVLGMNNPPQTVTWQIQGNRSSGTLMNKNGVLTIGSDETSKAITIRCTSTFDTTKYVNSYVTIAEGSIADPKTGIPDVPEAPLNTDYVRTRDISGKAVWKKAEFSQGGETDRGGYLGTFGSYAEMNAFAIPDTAQDGDYVIVSNDNTHQNFPAIYTIETVNGVKRFAFEVVLGRPFILGDKLDILYVLDNEDHSQYLRDIEVIDDFDTNEKRWELHESESAWKLVTELHDGFWNMIRHNPDRYRAAVGMNRHTGETFVYLTCFTDNHEFVEPVLKIPVENPRPIDNVLDWTNTIANGNIFTAANNVEFIQYEFDPENFTLHVVVQNEIPAETDPGVSPWATVVGEYTLMKNGEVIGPLADVTDPTGYIWTSNRENFMIGSAGDGTQMFCYNIDDNTSFIFDVPAGAKTDYQMATDLNERYFMMFIDGTHAVWVDRKTQQVKQVVWRPSGYSGLSTPTALTRPSISVDGKYYLHTSTNASTPTFSTFDFDTGDFVTEAPIKGTSSSAIGLSDGKRVATNTPEGEISIYDIDANGALTRIHNETPFTCRYVVAPTGYQNNLLFIKVEAGSNCPAWFIYDCDTYQITSQSAIIDKYCLQTNPQGKGCTYMISSSEGPRYLLTFANETDSGLIIERDMTQEGVWREYELPFGGLGNDKHNYNQPLVLNNGKTLILTDSQGNPRQYDMINNVEVEMGDIPGGGGGGSTDGNNNMVQIDDNHVAWCTGKGITVYRIAEDGTRIVILQIPEQQAVVLGFNR